MPRLHCTRLEMTVTFSRTSVDGMRMSNAVYNNTSLHRFELAVEGHIAFSEYTRTSDTITFVHTVVPQELGGRGIGSQLARGALDAVRAQGLKVVAQCPFIAAYIAKHADYQDLLKDAA
jgi:predicted GNAT family acetyltransferase